LKIRLKNKDNPAYRPGGEFYIPGVKSRRNERREVRGSEGRKGRMKRRDNETTLSAYPNIIITVASLVSPTIHCSLLRLSQFAAMCLPRRPDGSLPKRTDIDAKNTAARLGKWERDQNRKAADTNEMELRNLLASVCDDLIDEEGEDSGIGGPTRVEIPQPTPVEEKSINIRQRMLMVAGVQSDLHSIIDRVNKEMGQNGEEITTLLKLAYKILSRETLSGT